MMRFSGNTIYALAPRPVQLYVTQSNNELELRDLTNKLFVNVELLNKVSESLFSGSTTSCQTYSIQNITYNVDFTRLTQ